MIKHILVATDFGEPSNRALDVAIGMAQRLDAQISLLHVHQAAVAAVYGVGIEWPIEQVALASQAMLDQQVEKAQQRYPAIAGILKGGIAADEILATAQERGADMIVMGTHGRSGLSRVMMGSVAERVVRTSRWPVLTVSPTDDGATKLEPIWERAAAVPGKFDHILVASDLSEASEHALDLALALAERFDARVTLLHVYYVPRPIYDVAVVWPTEELAVRAKRALDAAVAKARQRYLKCEGELQAGAPADRILDTAKRRAADLIVVGTHSRRELAHALLGSVAERVVRTSPLPVLSVAAPKSA